MAEKYSITPIYEILSQYSVDRHLGCAYQQTGYFAILKPFGGLCISDEIGIPFCFFNSGILISTALLK